MMTTNHLARTVWLPFVAASLTLALSPAAGAQNAPAATAQPDQPKLGADAIQQSSSRAKAYFHASLADIYEEEAVNSGQPEYVTHAIEEYKDALNADPSSAQLADALADLYFRTPGHMR